MLVIDHLMTPCEIEIYTGYIYTTQATKLGYISIDKKSIT